MIKQNLIIYKFNLLYHILEELDLDLNFKINFIDNKDSLKNKIIKHNNYLIITNMIDYKKPELIIAILIGVVGSFFIFKNEDTIDK